MTLDESSKPNRICNCSHATGSSPYNSWAIISFTQLTGEIYRSQTRKLGEEFLLTRNPLNITNIIRNGIAMPWAICAVFATAATAEQRASMATNKRSDHA